MVYHRAMDDERKTALHVFEAASIGYLAYDRMIKNEVKRQSELRAQRDREYYTTNISLLKILSIDFAAEPLGNVKPNFDGMPSGQLFMVIQQAATDGAELTITWESDLDEKLHTDTMFVEDWNSTSLTVYRRRTEEEVASFDRFRQEDAQKARIAKASRGPWYRRFFG